MSKVFAPYCSPHECGCVAADTLSVGYQPQAMCDDMSKGIKPPPTSRLALPVPDDVDDAAAAAVMKSGGGPNGPFPQGPNYWACRAAVAQTCGGWDSWENPGSCHGCAMGNLGGNFQMQVCKQAICRRFVVSQPCGFD